MEPRAVLALALALWACDPVRPVAPEVTPLVDAAVAARSVEVELTGVVTTRINRVVPAEFEGRVVALLAQPGQRVRAGDPVARLDDTQLRKQLEAARASEDAARADLARARTEKEEADRRRRLERRLHRRGAVAREEIRQAEFGEQRAIAGLRQAGAALRKAGAERAQLQTQLTRATLRAPIDGVVSMMRAKEGEMVPPGSPVARVFDASDLWLRFAVEHDKGAVVEPGTEVMVDVPGLDEPIRATVRHVSTVLEPPLQLLVADADIEDSTVARKPIQVGVVGRVRIARAQ